jgi:putative aminopeptidase FrvX
MRSLLVVSAIAASVAHFLLNAEESVRFDQLPQEIIEARLKEYSGDDRKREGVLKQMFTEAGCTDQHLTEQEVKGSRLPNVICVLPGSSDRVIIVGAHYDHVPAGDGVVDNWSGASLLPSLYQSVKVEPRMHSYIFIGFTDEEKGLVGSRYYVSHMSPEQVAATDAMVNMDTLGLAPTKVWISHADKTLLSALNSIASALNEPVAAVNVDQVGTADSEPFSERRIPRITIHSLTQQTWDEHILHTSKDKLSEIQLNDYYQTYRLLAGYIAYLDGFSSVPLAGNTRE